MRVWVALVGIATGVLIAGYAIFGARTDEERIIAQLERLERAVHVDGEKANPVILAARINGEFEEIFTKDVSYSIPELTSGEHGRAALARLAAQSVVYFRTLDIDFGSIDVDVTGGGKGAQVSAVARVNADRGDGVERDEREVRFEFVEGDGAWLIDGVRVFPKTEDTEE